MTMNESIKSALKLARNRGYAHFTSNSDINQTTRIILNRLGDMKTEQPEEPEKVFTHRSIFHRIITLPIILALCSAHFGVCVLLMLFIHPEIKRYDRYMYYARWGWGKRPYYKEWNDQLANEEK